MKTLLYVLLIAFIFNPDSTEKKDGEIGLKVTITSYEAYYRFLKDTSKLSVSELSIDGVAMNRVSGFALQSDSFFNKLAGMKNLKKLNIEYCQLTEVPHQILCLNKLRKLSLMGNLIKVCPPLISQMDSIKEIELRYNRIESMTDLLSGEISASNLSALSLVGNRIDSIPESICKLKYLYFLALGSNNIKSIPCCISNYECFEFTMSNNPLEEIPDCFCRYYKDWFHMDFTIRKNVKIPECLDDTSIPFKNRFYYR